MYCGSFPNKMIQIFMKADSDAKQTQQMTLTNASLSKSTLNVSSITTFRTKKQDSIISKKFSRNQFLDPQLHLHEQESLRIVQNQSPGRQNEELENLKLKHQISFGEYLIEQINQERNEQQQDQILEVLDEQNDEILDKNQKNVNKSYFNTQQKVQDDSINLLANKQANMIQRKRSKNQSKLSFQFQILIQIQGSELSKNYNQAPVNNLTEDPFYKSTSILNVYPPQQLSEQINHNQFSTLQQKNIIQAMDTSTNQSKFLLKMDKLNNKDVIEQKLSELRKQCKNLRKDAFDTSAIVTEVNSSVMYTQQNSIKE